MELRDVLIQHVRTMESQRKAAKCTRQIGARSQATRNKGNALGSVGTVEHEVGVPRARERERRKKKGRACILI